MIIRKLTDNMNNKLIDKNDIQMSVSVIGIKLLYNINLFWLHICTVQQVQMLNYNIDNILRWIYT